MSRAFSDNRQAP
jgi:hypothetical protein